MNQEIRRLNTLRGLAALIVVISHYSNDTLILGGLLGYGAGQLGVMLFFVLSGFLMTHLYGTQALDSSAAKRFAIARIARVVPLFVVVVIASYALYKAGIRDVFYTSPTAKRLASHPLCLRCVDAVSSCLVYASLRPRD